MALNLDCKSIRFIKNVMIQFFQAKLASYRKFLIKNEKTKNYVIHCRFMREIMYSKKRKRFGKVDPKSVSIISEIC